MHGNCYFSSFYWTTAHTRLNHIGTEEFLTQHVERIDNLKTIENELWDNYHKEKNPVNKCKILMQIADIQLYLSSYFDSTRYVLEQGAKTKQQDKDKDTYSKRFANSIFFYSLHVHQNRPSH